MKQWKTIIIFGISLVVLIGILIAAPYLGGGDGNESSNVTPTPAIDPVISVTESDVKMITLENEEGVLKFSRVKVQNSSNESGNLSETTEEYEWILSSPEDLNFNKSAVQSRISGFINIIASSQVGDDIADLSEYGLDNPGATVTIELASGEVKKVLYGNETVGGAGRYVMLEGTSRVCTVTASRASGAYISLLNILDNNILNSLTSGITDRIEFTRKKDNLSFEVLSNKDGSQEEGTPNTWKFVSPIDAETSMDGFYAFLEGLYTISPMEFVEIYPEDLSAYGLDNPEYEIVYFSGDREITIKLGGNAAGGNMYGYSTHTDSVFIINISALTNIDKPIRELLTPFVHLPAIWDVNTIEINIDSLRIFCEIKDDQNKEEPSDFKVNGLNANVENKSGSSYFRGFYQAIISIYIDGIDPEANPEYNPEISVEYLMKDTNQDTLIEFVNRDDVTYYVFKQGIYTGYYINSSSFYSEQSGREGLLAKYDELMNAIENQVDGVYN